jgi:hypothetical protein
LEYFIMSNMAGLGDLVAQIKEASRSIEQGEARVGNRLNSIEASVNELYKRTGRPGAEWTASDETDERRSAIGCARSTRA